MKKAMNLFIPLLSIYLGNFFLNILNNQVEANGGDLYKYLIYAVEFLIGMSFAVFILFSREDHTIAINIIIVLLLLAITIFSYRGLPQQVAFAQSAIDYGMQRAKLMMMWLGVTTMAAAYEIMKR